MTTVLPDDVAEAIARIEVPTDDAVIPQPGLTGELAALDSWWRHRAGEVPVTTTPITVEPAPSTSAHALSAGLAAADRAIDGGATLLIPRVARPEGAGPALIVGSSDDIVPRSVIGLLTKRDASSVLGQPEGMPDADWMSACARIRDTMAEHRGLLGDHLALLDSVGGQDIAAVAGTLLGASARRTPCLIDGTSEWAAALVADRIAHRARHWWRAAATSTDPARIAARERIDVPAGLPLNLDDDEGWGARVMVTMLEMLRAPRE